jgi:hypothetical protein
MLVFAVCVEAVALEVECGAGLSISEAIVVRE